jgi:hypothetical protein
MTKADKKRVARFKRVCTPMLSRLGILQTYDVRLYWEKFIIGGTQAPKNDKVGALMEITSNYPYRDLHIHVSRKGFDDIADEMLERVIIHECLHPILFGWVHKSWDSLGHVRTDGEVYDEEGVVSLMTQWLAITRSELY